MKKLLVLATAAAGLTLGACASQSPDYDNTGYDTYGTYGSSGTVTPSLGVTGAPSEECPGPSPDTGAATAGPGHAGSAGCLDRD